MEPKTTSEAATRVLYCCHPVGGDVAGNVKRALDWLRFLRASEPNIVIIAPWLASLASGEDDNDPAQREHGLRDAEAVVARCDGVILVGGRISSGMQREADAAIAADIDIDDLTYLGPVAPRESMAGLLSGSMIRTRISDRDRRGKARVVRAELYEAAQGLASLDVPTRGDKTAADYEADLKTWALARAEAQGRLERAVSAMVVRK